MRVPRCLAQDLDFNLDLLWGGAPTTRDWIPRALWPLPGEGQKPFPTTFLSPVSQACETEPQIRRVKWIESRLSISSIFRAYYFCGL